MKVKCLICEKELELDDYYLNDGGYISIEFHYGSRHDQCHGMPDSGSSVEGAYRTAASRGGAFQELLLAADKIEAYICDDCFEKKHALMRGFVIERSVDMRELKPLSRGQQSLEPWDLNEEQAAAIQQAIQDGTARPLMKIQPLPEYPHDAP